VSEVRLGAQVKGTDGSFGHVRQAIIDASVNRIVHLVVGEGGFGGHHRAVPMTAVLEANHLEVVVDLDRAALRALPVMDGKAHSGLIPPGERPEITRLSGADDLPLVVAAAELGVVDADGRHVGVVDEWWVDDHDLPQITSVVAIRSGGLRLDQYVAVPATHVYIDPTPSVRLALTEVDLDALRHEPVLPGVHLRSVEPDRLDLDGWTLRDPDEVAAQGPHPPPPPTGATAP